MNKAIFIDKDGTLVKNIPYNVEPSLIELEYGAGSSLKLLKQSDYLLVVVSNQSGVARGYFELNALELVKDRIQALLHTDNVAIDAFYFCPHYPEGQDESYAIQCECRKPEPGMILRAAVDFNIDLSLSWMIGDILHDVEAGNKAGCTTILIDNGNETEWITNEMRWPAYIVKNLEHAATVILQSEKNARPELELS